MKIVNFNYKDILKYLLLLVQWERIKKTDIVSPFPIVLLKCQKSARRIQHISKSSGFGEDATEITVPLSSNSPEECQACYSPGWAANSGPCSNYQGYFKEQIRTLPDALIRALSSCTQILPFSQESPLSLALWFLVCRFRMS